MAPGTSPPELSGFTEPLVGADGYTLPDAQHDVVVSCERGLRKASPRS